jgi:hypothetical protein
MMVSGFTSHSYQNPHEAQLLFGRGFRAGMDRREQKKVHDPKYLYLMFSAFLCGANIFSGLVKINCFSKTFS